MSFRDSQFFFPVGGLVLFRLGRSGRTPPQSCDCPYRTTALLNFFPGTPYYHRTGIPAVSPGQTQTLLTELLLTQILSAARIFALRDRGLLSTSSSDAVTGFLVSNRKCMSFAPSRIASFTILSSSE